MSNAARITRAAAAGVLLLAFPQSPAWGWGARTHEIINRRAVEILPEDARRAWTPFAAELAAHANDADRRKKDSREEPPRHFIDIDVYGESPFDNVPHDRQVLEEKRGKNAVQRGGVVPWAIGECYENLVESLKARDWETAVTWAADLGHYTADAHQPLHCTKNHDGQNTGNKGVHFRFEVMMMDRFFEESMLDHDSSLPAINRGPVELCFDWIPEAYSGIEAILIADRDGRALDPGFEDRYYERLWEGTEDVAIRQTQSATTAFAALLHAAWTEAGTPEPPAESPSSELVSREAIPPKESSRKTVLTVSGIAVGVLLAAFLIGRS